MIKIKKKNMNNKVKIFNKSILWLERVKDPMEYLNKKSNEHMDTNEDVSNYGQDKIKYYTNRIKDEIVYKKNNIFKVTKRSDKKTIIKNEDSSVSLRKDLRDNKILNQSKKIDEIASRGKQLMIEKVQSTIKNTKRISNRMYVGIKNILSTLKSLISILGFSGTICFIIIIIVCLLSLILASVYGIFFSNEGNSLTMNSVISDMNKDISYKIDNILLVNEYDDYVVESTFSNWKEILAVYSVKYNNSETNHVVFYLDDTNISNIKNVFWSANNISYKILENCDQENTCKNVLYINMASKSLEEIVNVFELNENQIEQVKELLLPKYDDLWNKLIYGSNYGKWVNWRQKGSVWSNIKIGNTNKTIGKIGCLVTSISILIEKSGVSNPIRPFNPGTFVEKLNKNNGFDSSGNLYFGSVKKVVPNFEYVGGINLTGKTKDEKFKIINDYYSKISGQLS